MTVPAITTAAPLPAGSNPVHVYLASLAPGEGRRSMASTLAQVAAMLVCQYSKISQ